MYKLATSNRNAVCSPHFPCCVHHLSLLLQDSKHTYPDVSVLLAILSMFYEKTPAIHCRVHTLLVLRPRVITELQKLCHVRLSTMLHGAVKIGVAIGIDPGLMIISSGNG